MLLKTKTLTKLLHLRRLYSNRNILHLNDRGMFQDIFPDTAASKVTDLCNSAPQTVYAGFDPTAESLHIGNLLILINLLQWQRSGHKVIALVGGATGLIGDPSGRNTERDALTTSYVNTNVDNITQDIARIFKNHETYYWSEPHRLEPIKIVNNRDWYTDMNVIHMFSGIGRHFRMGTMLSRTSVQTRLQSPMGMSFTEFSYQLFQAYDWLHLLREHDCRFQIGGCDQMGNIMSGHDLISRVARTPVYGLTLPLVTTELGDKFGKSAGNAIWLAANKTTPFTLYQFFVRTADTEVEKLLKLFTFEPVHKITEIMTKHRLKPELRHAQKHLADYVTTLVHGPTGLNSARLASAALYDGDLKSLALIPMQDLTSIFQNATTVELLPEAGMTMLDLAMKAKCFPTQADAVRIINAGGFYLNHKRVSNCNEVLNPECHFLKNGITLCRVGKKNYYLLKWLL